MKNAIYMLLAMISLTSFARPEQNSFANCLEGEHAVALSGGKMKCTPIPGYQRLCPEGEHAVALTGGKMKCTPIPGYQRLCPEGEHATALPGGKMKCEKIP